MPDTPIIVLHPGEDLTVLERVVVAPSRGVFSPLAPDMVTAEGQLVEIGQSIGSIDSSGTMVPVTSPFSGLLMGMLVQDGERVREGEPVAWLRVVAA